MRRTCSCRYHTNQVYDGEWVDGSRAGFGSEVSDAENMYVGGWEHGEHHGYGVLATADAVYFGVWVAGACANN
jgi:hypothetical protein